MSDLRELAASVDMLDEFERHVPIHNLGLGVVLYVPNVRDRMLGSQPVIGVSHAFQNACNNVSFNKRLMPAVSLRRQAFANRPRLLTSCQTKLQQVMPRPSDARNRQIVAQPNEVHVVRFNVKAQRAAKPSAGAKG
jgi:hypothetical protein